MKSTNQKIQTVVAGNTGKQKSGLKKPFFVVASLILCAAAPLPSFGETLVGAGIDAGTLGAGAEAAVSVTRYSNIRGGFNDFSYTDTFTKDGINYGGTLNLRSARVTYDQYFKHLGGFHISPGALLYNGNSGSASANIPAGQSFTLGNQTYYSSVSNPVTGTGNVTFGKAAPMVLVGFGNLLPRSSRHFAVSLEAGVVFEGSPKAVLSLGGSSCLLSPTSGCVNTATDPGVQANLMSEQNKINNDMAPFKYYPVAELGISYRFGK